MSTMTPFAIFIAPRAPAPAQVPASLRLESVRKKGSEDETQEARWPAKPRAIPEIRVDSRREKETMRVNQP